MTHPRCETCNRQPKDSDEDAIISAFNNLVGGIEFTGSSDDKRICINGEEMTPQDFIRRHDAGEFGKPKEADDAK